MVLYVIVLHYVWACLLYVNEDVSSITAIAAMRYIMPRPFTMMAMFAAASLALLALFLPGWRRSLFLMLPQQFLLFISAGGAVEAMWEGQFADGVVRPHTFLIADQIHMILTAVFHSLAMFQIGRSGWYGTS